MMKKKETGVYQLENGNWEYRFTITKGGKKNHYRKRKDDNGNVFRTQTQAKRARTEAIKKYRQSECLSVRSSLGMVTVRQVYEEYCETGRYDKAYTTIKKQDSLWKNHICDKFGDRYIDDITVAEINDYLSYLYYNEGRAYGYVEAFLKMFYLIFGQAYSRDYLDSEIYSKLCLNKGTKIHMPKRKTDDENDVVTFSKKEIRILDDYFSGSNGETAYYLGKFSGLRINECYGLKWDNVDVENGVIIIDRQMQYQNGLIKLVPLKTRNAKRTIYMNDVLQKYFTVLLKNRGNAEQNMSEVRLQNQTFITDVDGQIISSLQLVNTLDNGKIQTVNSMKYHTRRLKEICDISFKFHYLRHTYGTAMADMNTPMHLLCNQMGHSSSKVTERYYISMSKTGIEILRDNLNKL